MGFRFKMTVGAAILAVTAMVSGTVGPVLAAGGEDTIKMRVQHMKAGIAKPFGVAKAFVTKGTGTAADVAKNATMLSEGAMKIAEGYPKGTARGDYDAKMTRALPKIWEDWAGFEASAKVLADEAAKLATVAATGDAAAIKAQFAMVGKNGCGGCHKVYRGDKVK